MKKITFTMAALLVASLTFGQSIDQSIYGNATNTNTNNTVLDACSQEFSDEDLQLANAVTDHGPFAVANDFFVEANSTFELQNVTFLLLPLASDFGDITSATISIFDDGGINEPNSTLEVATSTLTNINVETHPETFAGFPMFIAQYEFDEAIVLENNENTEAKFWLSLEVTSGSAQHIYWVGYIWDETSGSSFNYQSEDGGITFAPITSVDIPDEFFDSVWTLEGECNVLSLSENLQSQVSVYPVPSSDVINIKTPSSIQVTGAILYDLLGKNTGVVYTNNQLDISGLSRGVYLLTVETNEGTLTQKVVKK